MHMAAFGLVCKMALGEPTLALVAQMGLETLLLPALTM